MTTILIPNTDQSIIIRESDQYFDATHYLHQRGSAIKKWKQLKANKDKIRLIQSITKKTEAELITRKPGQGVHCWIHPLVAVEVIKSFAGDFIFATLEAAGYPDIPLDDQFDTVVTLPTTPAGLLDFFTQTCRKFGSQLYANGYFNLSTIAKCLGIRDWEQINRKSQCILGDTTLAQPLNTIGTNLTPIGLAPTQSTITMITSRYQNSKRVLLETQNTEELLKWEHLKKTTPGFPSNLTVLTRIAGVPVTTMLFVYNLLSALSSPVARAIVSANMDLGALLQQGDIQAVAAVNEHAERMAL